MLIKNAMLFTAENEFVKQDISFDTHITQIGHIDSPGEMDAEGYYIIPGLIDVHTHGAVGCDFSDGRPEGMRHLSDYYASHGVTSFCATMMTLPEDALAKAVECVRDYRRKDRDARCVGVYLEGPFLSAEKHGAQATDHLQMPDIAIFERLNKSSGNQVKLVGVAPERPGAQAFIKKASRICTVSLAHTAADYDTAMQAYLSGATHTTHLFNAMNGLHHRQPAVVGAAFDSGAYAELICDGIHVHPSVIRMAFKLFEDKLILVSDSVRGAGMPDGSYDLGGQTFTVKDGKATLKDNTIAGSTMHLLQAVRNAISYGIAPGDAIAAATIAPARTIGMEAYIGSLSVGKWADMLLLDSQFQLVSTIINGEVINNGV